MLISRVSLTSALSVAVPVLALLVLFLDLSSGDVNLLTIFYDVIFVIAAIVYAGSLREDQTALLGLSMFLLIPFGDNGENAAAFALRFLFEIHDHFYGLLRASIGA